MAPPGPDRACSPAGPPASPRRSEEPQLPARPAADGVTMLPGHTAPHCPDAGAAAGRRRRRREGDAAASCKQPLPSRQMDYKKISEDVAGKMLSYIRDTSGWKVIKKGKRITVAVRPSTDYSGNTYRVDAIIEKPAEKVFQFMLLPEYRTKWDKSLQSYKIVDQVDQDTAIYHSITHSYGFGLVPPRDFVFIVHVKRYGTLLTTNSTSVEHPRCPATPAYIRGKTYPSSFACYPSPENPNHCKMVAIVQVDLGGSLRPSVVQSVMPTSLMNLVTDCRTGIKSLK